MSQRAPKDPNPAGRDAQGTADEFSRAAASAQPGFLREFWDFLMYNKKWWLAPILVLLLLLGVLIVLGGTGAAPFIYTLF